MYPLGVVHVGAQHMHRTQGIQPPLLLRCHRRGTEVQGLKCNRVLAKQAAFSCKVTLEPSKLKWEKYGYLVKHECSLPALQGSKREGVQAFME